MRKFINKNLSVLLLALALAISFTACGQSKSGELKEISDLTVPEFTVSINGISVSGETLEEAGCGLYEASVTSVNTHGTKSTAVYDGFRLTDIVKAVGLEGEAEGYTVTCDDGYELEFEELNDQAMLAIYKDGEPFKKNPWFVPCDSGSTSDQMKGCVKIVIDGIKASE